ncbi:MAG: hypothetical protein ACRYGR_00350 [Janthinobacterium lividum]
MFSKLLRYLISSTLLICLIGSNSYSSDRIDLNEKTPTFKQKHYEKLDEQNPIKKIEFQDIEAGYIAD